MPFDSIKEAVSEKVSPVFSGLGTEGKLGALSGLGDTDLGKTFSFGLDFVKGTFSSTKDLFGKVQERFQELRESQETGAEAIERQTEELASAQQESAEMVSASVTSLQESIETLHREDARREELRLQTEAEEKEKQEKMDAKEAKKEEKREAEQTREIKGLGTKLTLLSLSNALSGFGGLLGGVFGGLGIKSLLGLGAAAVGGTGAALGLRHLFGGSFRPEFLGGEGDARGPGGEEPLVSSSTKTSVATGAASGALRLGNQAAQRGIAALGEAQPAASRTGRILQGAKGASLRGLGTVSRIGAASASFGGTILGAGGGVVRGINEYSRTGDLSAAALAGGGEIAKQTAIQIGANQLVQRGLPSLGSKIAQRAAGSAIGKSIGSAVGTSLPQALGPVAVSAGATAAAFTVLGNEALAAGEGVREFMEKRAAGERTEVESGKERAGDRFYLSELLEKGKFLVSREEFQSLDLGGQLKEFMEGVEVSRSSVEEYGKQVDKGKYQLTEEQKDRYTGRFAVAGSVLNERREMLRGELGEEEFSRFEKLAGIVRGQTESRGFFEKLRMFGEEVGTDREQSAGMNFLGDSYSRARTLGEEISGRYLDSISGALESGVDAQRLAVLRDRISVMVKEGSPIDAITEATEQYIEDFGLATEETRAAAESFREASQKELEDTQREAEDQKKGLFSRLFGGRDSFSQLIGEGGIGEGLNRLKGLAGEVVDLGSSAVPLASRARFPEASGDRTVLKDMSLPPETVRATQQIVSPPSPRMKPEVMEEMASEVSLQRDRGMMELQREFSRMGAELSKLGKERGGKGKETPAAQVNNLTLTLDRMPDSTGLIHHNAYNL